MDVNSTKNLNFYLHLNSIYLLFIFDKNKANEIICIQIHADISIENEVVCHIEEKKVTIL